jgi:hypothetical protein
LPGFRAPAVTAGSHGAQARQLLTFTARRSILPAANYRRMQTGAAATIAALGTLAMGNLFAVIIFFGVGLAYNLYGS